MPCDLLKHLQVFVRDIRVYKMQSSCMDLAALRLSVNSFVEVLQAWTAKEDIGGC